MSQCQQPYDLWLFPTFTSSYPSVWIVLSHESSTLFPIEVKKQVLDFFLTVVQDDSEWFLFIMKVFAEIHRRYYWGDCSNYVLQTTSCPQKQVVPAFCYCLRIISFLRRNLQQGFKEKYKAIWQLFASSWNMKHTICKWWTKTIAYVS